MKAKSGLLAASLFLGVPGSVFSILGVALVSYIALDHNPNGEYCAGKDPCQLTPNFYWLCAAWGLAGLLAGLLLGLLAYLLVFAVNWFRNAARSHVKS